MILWGRIRRLAFRLAPLSAALLLSGCDWAVLNPKGPIADGNATLFSLRTRVDARRAQP